MEQYILQKRTRQIRQLAEQEGFDFCGFAQADFLAEEADRYEEWLKKGMHGKMSYLEKNVDKRLDPRKLVDGAESVITLLYNYYPEQDLSTEQEYKIAKYAYGEDYHFVVKRKLKSLFQQIRDQVGHIEGRVFVDSAPVMERQWAQRAGLGWIGKNSLLLNRTMGSFFFIAEIICDMKLEPDGPMKDYCGTCTRCMDACPTDAIPLPYVVDASRCISYLTIELKDEIIPDEFSGQMENWIFGCDICQDVCPWNRFAKAHREPAFVPSDQVASLSKDDWKALDEHTFKTLFKHSPLKRTKYQGIMRNIQFTERL